MYNSCVCALERMNYISKYTTTTRNYVGIYQWVDSYKRWNDTKNLMPDRWKIYVAE